MLTLRSPRKLITTTRAARQKNYDCKEIRQDQSRLTSIAARLSSLDFHAGYAFTLRIARVTWPSCPIPRRSASQRFLTPVGFPISAATTEVSLTHFPLPNNCDASSWVLAAAPAAPARFPAISDFCLRRMPRNCSTFPGGNACPSAPTHAPASRS